MASTSLSSSRPNDIFLSFRGEDTRYSFTDHLYHALIRAGFRTFRDNDEIDRGQQLKPEIESAIIKSRSSIIVLSHNYAKSRWCLDELWLILEQRRTCNCFVLYHVDPSDVRNQRRNFAIEPKEGVAEYNVKRWKSALTEVANLTGMSVSGPETNFIAEIVDTIECKLDLKLVAALSHLIGIETRAESINSWLENEQPHAEFLAICGIGGSGKTTLAQYIYNLKKHKFDRSSFLQEIGKHCQQSHGLLGLQKQLLRDLLGGKNMKISSVHEATSKIEMAIQMRRVLIVLDDIDEHEQLVALLGTKTFDTQSKIIITTRLLDIHAWFGFISWKCCVHRVKLFNDDESLELLCCHAFGSKIPIQGFEDLALQLAQYCEGNPLALKVLGSSLFVSDEDPQDRNSIIEIWTSIINSLDSVEGDIDHKIQGILRRSFDLLARDSHRELFIHIARFFVGEYEDDVVRMLGHDWRAKSGIMTLINRCFLTVSPSKKLMMHQLLQDMGRNIACEESKDHAERTRVWHDDEAYRVLAKEGVSKMFESLALDIRKLKEVTEVLALQTSSLVNLDKLKLPNQNGIGPLENIAELNVTSLHVSSTASIHPCRRFSLAEMQSATEDFNDESVIGQGGFGKVYKVVYILKKLVMLWPSNAWILRPTRGN